MSSKQRIHSLLHQAIMERRHSNWTMRKYNLCSYREKTGRERHTSEGLREKISIFIHPEIGSTCTLTTSANWCDCTLTTSANGQLARVANWQQAPTPENEKTKNFSQPRPNLPLQAGSKTKPEAKYWPKETSEQGKTLAPIGDGATVRVGTAPINPTMKIWKFQKRRGQIWSFGAEQRFYPIKEWTTRANQAGKDQNQPKRQDKIQLMSP